MATLLPRFCGANPIQDLRKSTLETPFLGAHSCAPLPDIALVRKSYYREEGKVKKMIALTINVILTALPLKRGLMAFT